MLARARFINEEQQRFFSLQCTKQNALELITGCAIPFFGMAFLFFYNRFLEPVLKPLAGCKAPSFGAIRRLFFGEYAPILAKK